MSKNVAVILGSFHKDESMEMLDEVKQYASQNNLNITEEVWVPGSMEKPLALKMLLSREDIDAAVVLGIIEKGETKHGFVMASSVVSAIVNLQLEFMKPVGVGILGPEILPSQIPCRVRPYAKAAISAMDTMLGVMSK
jgi:6,7-dimethyl-8-ribityllumazine synthase